MPKCKYCNTEIEWEGSDFNNGHIWQCENDMCGDFFCSKCAEENISKSYINNSDSLLCPDCVKNQSK